MNNFVKEGIFLKIQGDLHNDSHTVLELDSQISIAILFC